MFKGWFSKEEPNPRGMRSAAYRIAFTYSAAFALAVILLGVIVYFVADADFRQQEDDSISAESAALVREYVEAGRPHLIDSIAERDLGANIDAFGRALFDASGRHIAGSMVTTMPPAGWGDIVFVDPREGDDPARALTTVLPDGSRLVIAVDNEALERIDATILSLFAGGLLLVLAIGGVGALLLGAYLRRRIGRISHTAQAIISGDMAQRMAVSDRDDEFDRLAAALNLMLDRIADLLDNLRQVSSDVAHDLRTPLARLRNMIEQTLAGPADIAAYRVALQAALGRSDDLLSLFAAILRISEVEGGALRNAFSLVDLSGLAQDIHESFVPAVSDGGRQLTGRIEPGLTVHGDRELIAQAIINLLDNAQRHTPPGTEIALRLVKDSEGVRLIVSDNGPGVPAEDRGRIVRRFARLEASRSSPGHGLGLNLVSAIGSAHGAHLLIDDNAPGLRVSLTFPAAAS